MRRMADLAVALALAEHEAGHQTGDAGIDVHHGAASEVQHAHVEHQRTFAAPDHVGDRRVDEDRPAG